MKKLIGTMAVALLAAAAVFADLGVGAWCAAIFSPVVVNDEDITTGIRAPWGGNGRVVGLSFNGVAGDGKAGISTDLRYTSNNAGPTNGDTAVMWIKPIDMLRISFGKWDYTAFNSGVCLPSWDFLRPKNWIYDDDTFAFAQIGNKAGVQLELTPIEGLTIMWNLPVVNGEDAYKMFEAQEIGAMYKINSIGTIKAGFAGKGKKIGDKAASCNGTTCTPAVPNGEYTGTKKYLGDIMAAFELTAVENLFATAGVTFAIAESAYKDAQGGKFEMVRIGLGASYKINDAFSVMGNFNVVIYDGANKADPAMSFGVGASYNVTDAVQVVGDVRALIPNNDLDPVISFLIGVNYACSSNGLIGIGFQGMMDSNTTKLVGPVWIGDGGTPTQSKDFSMAIPIRMQLSF